LLIIAHFSLKKSKFITKMGFKADLSLFFSITNRHLSFWWTKSIVFKVDIET